jgi:CubicO group peptidase (beta-lactamase class C family)
MHDSSYDQPLTDSKTECSAAPFDGKGQAFAEGAHSYPELAAAGLWTTPSDLARFLLEIQKALAGKSRLLSESWSGEMLKPGALGNWGLGFHVGGKADNPYFEHGGVNTGFQSDMVAYKSGDGVVVMSNSDNGMIIASEIIRATALEYNWPDFRPEERTLQTISASEAQSYAGVYELSSRVTISISAKGTKLFAKFSGQPEFEIFFEGNRRFFWKVVDAEAEFETGSSGAVVGLDFSQNGQQSKARRLN